MRISNWKIKRMYISFFLFYPGLCALFGNGKVQVMHLIMTYDRGRMGWGSVGRKQRPKSRGLGLMACVSCGLLAANSTERSLVYRKSNHPWKTSSSQFPVAGNAAHVYPLPGIALEPVSYILEFHFCLVLSHFFLFSSLLLQFDTTVVAATAPAPVPTTLARQFETIWVEGSLINRIRKLDQQTWRYD